MEELLVVPDDVSPEPEVPPELLPVEPVPVEPEVLPEPVELPVVEPELPEVSEPVEPVEPVVPVEPVEPVEPVDPVELSLPEGLVVEDEEPDDVPPPASSVLRSQALRVSTADSATARTAADFMVDAYISVPF